MGSSEHAPRPWSRKGPPHRAHSFGSGLTWHYIIFAIKQSLLHGSRSFTGAYRRPQPRPRRLHPDPACGGPLMAASPHSHRFAGSQTKTTPSTSWISPLRSTPCFAGPPRLGHFHPTCNVTGAITAPRPQHTGGFGAGFGLVCVRVRPSSSGFAIRLVKAGTVCSS